MHLDTHRSQWECPSDRDPTEFGIFTWYQLRSARRQEQKEEEEKDEAEDSSLLDSSCSSDSCVAEKMEDDQEEKREGHWGEPSGVYAVSPHSDEGEDGRGKARGTWQSEETSERGAVVHDVVSHRECPFVFEVWGAEGIGATKQRLQTFPGSGSRCVIAGLDGTKRYSFAMRIVDSRTNLSSALSTPELVVSLRPVPPRDICISGLQSHGARLQWKHPYRHIARFIVEIAAVPDSVPWSHLAPGQWWSLPRRQQLLDRRDVQAFFARGLHRNLFFRRVFQGQEKNAVLTGLRADTVYIVRVRACNRAMERSAVPGEEDDRNGAALVRIGAFRTRAHAHRMR